MELKSVVSLVKEVEADTTIGYGRTYKANKRIKTATIPVGYADGYIRAIAKEGYIDINGKKAKILGRICMDQIIVNATDIDDIEMNDTVTLFGNGKANTAPTADDIAKWTNTINYEVVCLISKRVTRVFLKTGIMLK